MDDLIQLRVWFGVVEILVEAHDMPKGLTPKYVITCEGDNGVHEPHMVAPPRFYFFLSPGEYTIKTQFLGATAEDRNVMVNVGETARMKYHFHGRWAEGLPKPPRGLPRKPPVQQQPVQQVVYAMPGQPPPGYAAPPAAAAPAAAPAPPPSTQPSSFPTPGLPPAQQPAAAQPPRPVGTPAGHALGQGMHGVSSSIAPPMAPTHVVAPPPPPPSRPGGPSSAPGTPGWAPPPQR